MLYCWLYIYCFSLYWLPWKKLFEFHAVLYLIVLHNVWLEIFFLLCSLQCVAVGHCCHGDHRLCKHHDQHHFVVHQRQKGVFQELFPKHPTKIKTNTWSKPNVSWVSYESDQWPVFVRFHLQRWRTSEKQPYYTPSPIRMGRWGFVGFHGYLRPCGKVNRCWSCCWWRR